MEYVLETNGLCKHYRDFTALHGLNMHIPKGSIYGLGETAQAKQRLSALSAAYRNQRMAALHCMV